MIIAWLTGCAGAAVAGAAAAAGEAAGSGG